MRTRSFLICSWQRIQVVSRWSHVFLLFSRFGSGFLFPGVIQCAIQFTIFENPVSLTRAWPKHPVRFCDTCSIPNKIIASEWEERQKTRQLEMEACSKALAVLSSDDAHLEHYHGDRSHHVDIVFEAPRSKSSREMILRCSQVTLA